MKKIELIQTEKLVPYELNSKIHDPAQVKKIAESIKQFGWDQPIVVDKDYVVIKGHGRRLAAISLGMEVVPALVRDDLSPEQVRAARLADNRVAVGGMDTEMLKRELAELDFDLSGIFDDKELAFMEADLSDMDLGAFVPDLDEAVAAQAGESVRKIEEVDNRTVKIESALGFKTIQGKDERPVAFFMAMIESETGLTGADAFVQFATHYGEEKDNG